MPTSDPGRSNEWMVAVFLLGLLALNPPLLTLFDIGPDTRLFGIPLLFVFAFAAWAVLIALIGWAIRSRQHPHEIGVHDPPPPDPRRRGG